MARKPDDAENWTSGDAAAQEAELAGISDPSSVTKWVVEDQQFIGKNEMSAAEVAKLAGRLGDRAKRAGKAVRVVPVKGGWRVEVGHDKKGRK